MNKDNKALKEIQESVTLVEYLLHKNFDFNDPKYFSAKYVKLAIEWKRNQN